MRETDSDSDWTLLTYLMSPVDGSQPRWHRKHRNFAYNFSADDAIKFIQENRDEWGEHPIHVVFARDAENEED